MRNHTTPLRGERQRGMGARGDLKYTKSSYVVQTIHGELNSSQKHREINGFRGQEPD